MRQLFLLFAIAGATLGCVRAASSGSSNQADDAVQGKVSTRKPTELPGGIPGYEIIDDRMIVRAPLASLPGTAVISLEALSVTDGFVMSQARIANEVVKVTVSYEDGTVIPAEELLGDLQFCVMPRDEPEDPGSWRVLVLDDPAGAATLLQVISPQIITLDSDQRVTAHCFPHRATNSGFAVVAAREVPHSAIVVGGLNLTQALGGQRHKSSCVVLPGQGLKCWGYNAFAALGLGDTQNRGFNVAHMGENLPLLDLGTDLEIAQVTGGSGFHCAVFVDGRVKCWGDNYLGALGLGLGDIAPHRMVGDESADMGENLPFLDLGSDLRVRQLSSGNKFTCAVFDTGVLKCWGSASWGAVGRPTESGKTPESMGDNLPLVDVGSGRTVKRVAAGYGHTCAILDNDGLKCWGLGGNGRLGLGSTHNIGDEVGEMGESLPYVSLPDGKIPRDISLGDAHTCVVFTDHSLACWGENNYGQLGIESTDDIGDDPSEMGDGLRFVDLGAGAQVKKVAAGAWHTCALLLDGRVKCWGYHTAVRTYQCGRLAYGDQVGDMGDAVPAVNLGSDAFVVDLQVHWEFACAELDNGAVKCWGSNEFGALGQGSNVSSIGCTASQMGDSLLPVSF